MRDGPLRDHLVRPRQQRRRDGQSESLGGLQVDDQLELRRLLDGKLARLGALEDLVYVGSRTTEVVALVDPVGQQTSRFRVLRLIAGEWQVARACRLGDPASLAEEHRVTEDEERVRR